jgi:hypothetical protein
VRQFRDAAGVDWKVSFTTRSGTAASRDHYLPQEYREGWLLFESANEKRRVAPVPSDWESFSDQALAALCAGAASQPARQRGDTEAKVPAREEPLRPKLHDAERKLDETLDEVCESPAAAKLDTGELIRVEETLALAAEAAKEAVSLRRRMHVDRERDAGRAPGSESASGTGNTSPPPTGESGRPEH